jgi:hypothetical protein
MMRQTEPTSHWRFPFQYVFETTKKWVRTLLLTPYLEQKSGMHRATGRYIIPVTFESQLTRVREMLKSEATKGIMGPA